MNRTRCAEKAFADTSYPDKSRICCSTLCRSRPEGRVNRLLAY